MSRQSSEPDRTVEVVGPEAYRAMYDYSPDGVLFTAPDGRVFAANPAACQILGRTEAEVCALGRQGLADSSDERWGSLLEERERAGSARGIARMIRGDGALIEVEMSARIFLNARGERRTCTVMRDVTERVRMERELLRMSERLREQTLTDELTGLHNRRGFVAIGSQLLEVADRQSLTAVVLFLDVDNMKLLNDGHGHAAGDAALRAVAVALRDVLRRADTVARLAGDEFVALTFGLDDQDRASIERRIQGHLSKAPIVAGVPLSVEASMGWATRAPQEPKTIEDLLMQADSVMYRAKALKTNMAAGRAGGTSR